MNNNRIRTLNRLACLAALALIVPTVSMANVLTNPGFETDAVLNAGPVAGATGWVPSGNAYTASANGDPVRTGIGSLKLDGTGGFGVPLVSQTFPTTAGTFWNFEGYMRTPATLPADATFGLLKIVWMDAGNVELQPGSATVGGANNGANPGIESTPFLNNASAPNTWIFTRAAGIAPAGATQVRLIPLFVDQSAGVGYFDDLDATNLPPVGPPPIIINYPTNNAPTPTNNPATVLSLYNSSGTYTDHTVDTWYTPWSGNPGGNSDYTITNTSRVVKKYLGMGYAGVEFVSSPVDTTGYNTLHVDVWTPNADQFGIQLVSLDPATQAAQVNFLPASGKITTNNWVGLNIPLSQFVDANGNVDMTNLKQLLWIDNQGGGGFVNGNFYIDNVYFYSNSVVGPTVINYPTNAAPTPAQAPANVVSLYTSSGVYTSVPIDTWLTGWSAAAEVDYSITNASRVVKKYSSLNYAGVEFFNPKINATGMTTFHIDLWTPNATKFSTKLVSFGAVQAETEVVFTNNVIVTNTWVSLNIPISAFTNTPNFDVANLGQLLFINNNPGGAEFGTFFIDNVYFYAAAAPATPPTITSPAIAGGNFTAQSASQTGFNYILQATTSLAPASWSNVQTNAGTGSTLNFSVPVVPGSAQRFYRITVQ